MTAPAKNQVCFVLITFRGEDSNSRAPCRLTMATLCEFSSYSDNVGLRAFNLIQVQELA